MGAVRFRRCDSAQTSRAEYVIKAEALNKGRLEAAARLDTAVIKELPPLKLERALFETQVVALSEEDWGADGIDRVEFMVATNPGAAPGPLSKSPLAANFRALCWR